MGCLKGLFTMASNKRLLFNEIYDTIKPCPCWHAISLCLKSERNCKGFTLTDFSNEFDSMSSEPVNFFSNALELGGPFRHQQIICDVANKCLDILECYEEKLYWAKMAAPYLGHDISPIFHL